MNFTEEEKKAVVWSLLALADCDGSKTMDEVRKLTDISRSIGFKVSWDTLRSVNTMEPSDVYAIFRTFSEEKKAFVKKSLEDLAAIDGEINHLEKNALININYFGEL